mmetsp:Transcript_5459/g.9237  ORF Transcript_5459/g.9237 Transcript_5459/m.9237 type:complete len:142 (-) Transcript_5459:39-464(-)
MVRDLNSAKVSMPGQMEEKVDPVIHQKYFKWRTNLMATKMHWNDWFKGMSQLFLDINLPKILLLASSDRLDKTLQMALTVGKFKQKVIENVGHSIQEDSPQQCATIIKQFLERFHIPGDFQEQLHITSLSGKQVVIGQGDS